MNVLEFAVGVIVGLALSGSIPRIPVGIYSSLKKREYRIVDITDDIPKDHGNTPGD